MLTRMETCAAERSAHLCELVNADGAPFVYYFPAPGETLEHTPLLDSMLELMNKTGVVVSFRPTRA